MDYYHIAPSNLDRELTPSPTMQRNGGEGVEEEEDDDPNWLMVTKTKTTATRKRRTPAAPSSHCKSADSSHGSSRPIHASDDDNVILRQQQEQQVLPAYYKNDPIANRICELFDEMEPLEQVFGGQALNEESEADLLAVVEPPPAHVTGGVVLRRPRRSVDNIKGGAGPGGGGGGGFFSRRKQSVSGYFSDWTKWLRRAEDQEGAAGAAHINAVNGYKTGYSCQNGYAMLCYRLAMQMGDY